MRLPSLHYAAYCQNLAEVKRRVAEGCDVHEKDDAGRTALVWAIDMASTGCPGCAEAIVDYLVEAGARLEFSDARHPDIVSFAESIDPAIGRHIRDLLQRPA